MRLFLSGRIPGKAQAGVRALASALLCMGPKARGAFYAWTVTDALLERARAGVLEVDPGAVRETPTTWRLSSGATLEVKEGAGP